MNPLGADVALKLSALLAALTAITVEDLAAIKSAEVLGPDVTANIESLQNLTNSVDQSTIDQLNAARKAAGLPAL
jgi:hypothetical protein